MKSKQPFLKAFKLFLFWYGIAILILALFILILVVINDFGGENKITTWLKFLLAIFKSSITYLILCIPYFIFLLVRSLVRDYRKYQLFGLLKGFTLKLITPTFIIWGSFLIIDNYRQSENYNYTWDYSIENKSPTIRNHFQKDHKQRGIHYFGNSADTIAFETLKTNNVEWLTFVPFLSQENHDEPSLNKGFRRNDSTSRHERWRKLKQRADSYGFKIMLKPHVWLNNTSNGIWRSNIKMKTQAKWDAWFKDYSSYILDYAALAEELNIALFCIGTELHTSAKDQPQQWRALIKQIRNIYSGKLTYGANWDGEVNDVSFWEDLDFIGVQAYFPIAENRNPDLTELEAGWKKHYDMLQTLNETYNKPILFTELGYKSTPDAGIKPWEWNNLSNRFYKKISKQTQALCYQAFFNTVWQQPWFEGAHLWEWKSRNNNNGNNNGFTIQNKPALNIVAKGFGILKK